jgi:hypothetical protein
MLTRGTPHGIQVSGDRGEAEIRNACMTRVVYEDVWLAGCQYRYESRFRTKYSLEVSVNHIGGVEVPETLGDVGQLATGVSMGQVREEGHRRVRAGPHQGSSRYVPAGHRRTSNSKRAEGE